jgi:hypothetical protein
VVGDEVREGIEDQIVWNRLVVFLVSMSEKT